MVLLKPINSSRNVNSPRFVIVDFFYLHLNRFCSYFIKCRLFRWFVYIFNLTFESETLTQTDRRELHTVHSQSTATGGMAIATKEPWISFNDSPVFLFWWLRARFAKVLSNGVLAKRNNLFIVNWKLTNFSTFFNCFNYYTWLFLFLKKSIFYLNHSHLEYENIWRLWLHHRSR